MERGKSSPQQCGAAVDKTNVLKALDGLLDTGVAVTWSYFLILYLHPPDWPANVSGFT